METHMLVRLVVGLTIAVVALAIAGGADIVRVHDVRAHVRAARMADAIVRGGSPVEAVAEALPREGQQGAWRRAGSV